MGARSIPALFQAAAFLQDKRVPFGIGHALIFTPLGDRRRPLVVCFSTYVRNFLPSQTPCILNDPGVFRKFICLLHPQMTMVPLRPVSVFVV